VADFEIKVSGLKEVQKSLYQYSQQLGDRVVIAALREGAKLMQKNARANAPKKKGVLRKGIVVKNSKINNGKRKETIGVFLTLKKGKKLVNDDGKRIRDPNDPYYGRFIEDGWNVRGKSRTGKGQRQEIVSRFGRRTGRKSLPGLRDIPGIKFMRNAFNSTKEASANLIVQAAERGAEILKRRTGLK
jgi:HK97 gp10 family phage protein